MHRSKRQNRLARISSKMWWIMHQIVSAMTKMRKWKRRSRAMRILLVFWMEAIRNIYAVKLMQAVLGCVSWKKQI
ncbi:hypothetical protein ANCCAN_19947 [Ancylostoma caninum]|uniref:Uncharacterized protein n=1 Tax=Ancylostoma caninum TaxID=29170 RepID=A0A368FPP9_ANCCA|nr:hypothetical protein ANCCAN_19947 [Ancylostoma caninum]